MSSGGPLGDEELGVPKELGGMVRFRSRLMGSSPPSSTKPSLYPHTSRFAPRIGSPSCPIEEPSCAVSEKHHMTRLRGSAYTKLPPFLKVYSTSEAGKVYVDEFETTGSYILKAMEETLSYNICQKQVKTRQGNDGTTNGLTINKVLVSYSPGSIS